ncbi:hypothetical protein ACFGOO_03125 [Treponema vincentii]|uniref:hypothetical protein n=1 Tax=Treponema vincentii TaxID=69710 RepID=UPI0035F5A6E0
MEKNIKKESATFLAVEEHAANAGIAAPVFHAVMQAQCWAAGKRVEKTEFEKAVNAFLNAPIGG